MLRRAFRNLLNLDDPPERTALAFSIGTLIGFSPLLGLHTIIAAIIAVVWRLNKAALFTGVYISNPWTVAPVVAASWAIGRLFIETPPIALPRCAMDTPSWGRKEGVATKRGASLCGATGAGQSEPRPQGRPDRGPGSPGLFAHRWHITRAEEDL